MEDSNGAEEPAVEVARIACIDIPQAKLIHMVQPNYKEN